MCERLTYEGTGLHHKRSIKNVLRFELAPDPIILLGVGVYNGEEEELLDPDAIITFDRCTTSIKIWLTTPSNIPKQNIVLQNLNYEYWRRKKVGQKEDSK